MVGALGNISISATQDALDITDITGRAEVPAPLGIVRVLRKVLSLSCK